jgi:hypothetical protein
MAAFFLCAPGVFCADAAGTDAPDGQSDYSKGPLIGKNLFIPYLIHYTFPSLSARSGEKFAVEYHVSTYGVQDVQFLPPKDESSEDSGRGYDTDLVVRDYESFVGEAGFSFNLQKNLQIGLDMRLLAYSGGFLDPVIEVFHHIFGFPGGKREDFLQNQLYVNIPSDNGVTLFLDKPAVSFGDMDIWGKWTFFENKKLSLACLGAFKVPSGRLEALSGSNYPDIALGILSDLRPKWYFTLYGQAGLVLPFNGKSYPMFNGMAGLEINPWKRFSINVQMNIKTSPISNDIPWSWNETYHTNYKIYSLPQTNILVGFVVLSKNTAWQFYFEEDAFTNQGTDLTLNARFSHRLPHR